MTMATPRKIYKESRVPMPTWPGLYLNADGVEQPETIIRATHRLRQEGRWEQFRKRRLALKRRLVKAGEHYVNATKFESWAVTLKEFPPIPIEQWKDEPEEEEPDPEPTWTVPPLDVDEELSRLPTTDNRIPERSSEAAYMWVNDHRALSRESPAGNLYIINEDIQGCPTRGAWNLLYQAVKDPWQFRKEMNQRIKPAKAGEAEDTGPTDSDADLDAILGRAMA